LRFEIYLVLFGFGGIMADADETAKAEKRAAVKKRVSVISKALQYLVTRSRDADALWIAGGTIEEAEG
jgi:hypothetical protein